MSTYLVPALPWQHRLDHHSMSGRAANRANERQMDVAQADIEYWDERPCSICGRVSWNPSGYCDACERTQLRRAS